MVKVWSRGMRQMFGSTLVPVLALVLVLVLVLVWLLTRMKTRRSTSADRSSLTTLSKLSI